MFPVQVLPLIVFLNAKERKMPWIVFPVQVFPVAGTSQGCTSIERDQISINETKKVMEKNKCLPRGNASIL